MEGVQRKKDKTEEVYYVRGEKRGEKRTPFSCRHTIFHYKGSGNEYRYSSL